VLAELAAQVTVNVTWLAARRFIADEYVLDTLVAFEVDRSVAFTLPIPFSTACDCHEADACLVPVLGISTHPGLIPAAWPAPETTGAAFQRVLPVQHKPPQQKHELVICITTHRVQCVRRLATCMPLPYPYMALMAETLFGQVGDLMPHPGVHINLELHG
jgi:hypothetical protein